MMSGSQNKLISVLVPAYNSDRFLAEAIHSVLAENHNPLEIIVVDDGSTDRTGDVAKSFGDRVKYFRQENQGIGATRNRTVELASGELFAFIDADDRWVPGKLSRQLGALVDDATLDGVLGQVRQVQNGPQWHAETSKAQPEATDLYSGYVAGAMLIWRRSFERVGLFRTDCKVGETIDWFARANSCGLRLPVLPDVVLWRRIHDSNTGIREKDSRADYAKVLKANLDRMRAQRVQ